MDSEEILVSLKALEAQGHKEAVLTGVNISQYSDSSKNLTLLLTYLLEKTDFKRLRLSSLEPDGITPELISALKNERIRPHFHISLQSGSAKILERMNRKYDGKLVEKKLELLRSIKKDPFIACDIITGFPGETEEDFEETFSLCQRINFAWIHAFPYSPRPGTSAYCLKEKVPERISRLRLNRLLKLSDSGKKAYVRLCHGRTVEAIVEDGTENDNILPAVSENYLKLALNPVEFINARKGSLVSCRIVESPIENFDAKAVISV
jgi:threonylcarbamoyladenosine tRNA methylthiotransferase MtaB